LHPIKYLTSHEYIAQPHGRKVDPNGFDWSKLADLGLPMYYQGVPPGTPLLEMVEGRE